MTNNEISKPSGYDSPFEQIRRTNDAGAEFWSSRDFAEVLGYVNYRHFEAVIEKAKLACFNSGQRIEDHFVGADEMIEIGKGGQRVVKTTFMSRYACYLAIQNADPRKESSPTAKPISPFRPGVRNWLIWRWRKNGVSSFGRRYGSAISIWPVQPERLE